MDFIADKLTEKNVSIPSELLDKIIREIGLPLPHYYRGIKITEQLINVALECLNETQNKILPQNCKNDILSKTPDGLDYRIKERMDFDLRTANIVSDVLADAGIVKIIQVINPKTGRNIKATHLLHNWTW